MANKNKLPFTTDIPYLSEDKQPPRGVGLAEFRNLVFLRVGNGNRSVTISREGIWAGANRFEDAPWRVSSAGVETP